VGAEKDFNMITQKDDNSKSVRWEVKYMDEIANMPYQKGEFNPDWGFKCSVPFHIVSELPRHRYLDIEYSGHHHIKDKGNSLSTNLPNGLERQNWYFDCKTFTIRSYNSGFRYGHVLTIHSKGGSTDVTMWPI
jgi:uncharacterized protein YxeA